MTDQEQTLFYQTLGELIKQARKKAGHKQETFADLLGLHRVSIVNIEKGRQHPPIHLIWKMAKILNTDVQSLMPKLPSKEELSSNWKKLISKEVKGEKEALAKVSQFLEEIKTTKK